MFDFPFHSLSLFTPSHSSPSPSSPSPSPPSHPSQCTSPYSLPPFTTSPLFRHTITTPHSHTLTMHLSLLPAPLHNLTSLPPHHHHPPQSHPHHAPLPTHCPFTPSPLSLLTPQLCPPLPRCGKNPLEGGRLFAKLGRPFCNNCV